METFNTDSFVAILALVGVVIIVAALFSGVVERSNFPQVAVFIALGAVLGPGLGLLDVGLDSPVLRVVATLSLALVLFTDALTLSVKEVRQHARLTALVLGPGTLLTGVLVAFAGWALLGLEPAAAVIVGAALASTDPVLLRGFMRRPDVSGTARQVLRLESGLNDVVLLPVIVVAMTFLASGDAAGETNWTSVGLNLFLLGPGAGIAVGLLAVATLDLVRRRIGVRRDYESLYSLGVAFAAFAAAETVHGSGFLAVFAAGMTIAALDVELCDCFLEYGETTAEMALLFTFVIFGSSLIWQGFDVLSLPAAIFAALVLLIRPAAFLLSLARTRLDKHSRLLISWFGPRGLSTLLLVLLPVFEGVSGSARLFAICALVVLLSIMVHGGSLMLLGRGRRPARRAPPPESAPASTFPLPLVQAPSPREPLPGDGAADGQARPANLPGGDRERITLDEMKALLQAGEQVVVVDARSERTFADSDMLASGAVRIELNDAVRQAAQLGLPKDAWLAIFCA